MGGATLCNQVIEHICNFQESPSHVRLIGEALVQTLRLVCRFFSWQFTVHELLYLYTIVKGTRQKLPSDAVFLHTFIQPAAAFRPTLLIAPWCRMSNHFHRVSQTPWSNLVEGM